MSLELVKTRTSDGLRLDGALQTAANAAGSSLPLDAALLLSGVGSNFYGSTLIEHLATRLVARGVAALRVNTRGHDGVSTASTPSGGKLQGAAYESVDDCRYDVGAWIEFLLQRGFLRIGLIGHSLGAIKTLYAQAHEPHEAVCQVIAISPPRLCHDVFRDGPRAGPFLQSLRTAEELVARGEPQMLFQARFPFPLVISAATYLDKYGPANRYDILRFIDQIDCPVLFTFGQLELDAGNVAFAGLPEAIRGLNWQTPPPIVTIPDANHLYVGCHDPLAEAIESQLAG